MTVSGNWILQTYVKAFKRLRLRPLNSVKGGGKGDAGEGSNGGNQQHFEDFFEIWFWGKVETMVVGLKTFFVNQQRKLSGGWLGQVRRKQAWPFLYPASTWMVLYNINRYVYYNTIRNMICCTQRKFPSQYKKGNHIITIGNHDLGLPAEKAVEN